MRTACGHRCPVEGCQVELPREKLMCARHWGSLPTIMKDAVNRGWKRGSAQQYLKARAEAIKFVNVVTKSGN